MTVQEAAILFKETKDHKYFDIIYKKSRVKLKRLIKKYVKLDYADDILQDVYTKAFSRIEQYNPQYQFLTWLFTIAYHDSLQHCMKYENKTVFLSHIGVDGTGLNKSISSGQFNRAIENEYNINLYTYKENRDYYKDRKSAMIKNVNKEFTEDESNKFLMRFLFEMKYTEIAPMLNTNTRLSREPVIMIQNTIQDKLKIEFNAYK